MLETRAYSMIRLLNQQLTPFPYRKTYRNISLRPIMEFSCLGMLKIRKKHDTVLNSGNDHNDS